MKKLLTALILSCTAITANAEYTIMIPLEQAQGGHLPNGSIQIVGLSNLPVSPLEDLVLDCANNPTENTDECLKRVSAWEKFADDRGLLKDWQKLNWQSQALTSLPNAPYPLTSVNNVYLENNQLTSVDALSNLTSANFLFLSNNQLTNVDGLRNLKSVTSIALAGNPLTNIDGLANTLASSKILISQSYTGAKLPVNSRFCTLIPDSAFTKGYAQKSKLCESQ